MSTQLARAGQTAMPPRPLSGRHREPRRWLLKFSLPVSRVCVLVRRGRTAARARSGRDGQNARFAPPYVTCYSLEAGSELAWYYNAYFTSMCKVKEMTGDMTLELH